jgi:hypothetical protein
MKYLLFILTIFVCSAVTTMAQTIEHQVIDRQNSGEGLTYIFQNTEVKGTQFLKDTWMDANITNGSGYTFRHQSVKFDSYNNKMVYNRHDTAFELASGSYTVAIYPDPSDTSNKMLFKNGYTINGKIGPDKYVQVLAEGKTSLVKYIFKETEEYNEYGNASKFKRYKDMQQYYVAANNQFTPVTISKKNFEAFFQPKWAKMEPFLKQHNISGKDESGWAQALAYYNTL